MSELPNPADYVAVEVAGKVAGIPARTLRHWITTGKLAAIAGKRGKLVSMGEVEQLARMVGKPVGNTASPADNPATSAEEVAESLAESALVSDAARRQLATIRDEWLAPLIARMGELERENGRLQAERDDLRRRAEVAEAEVSRRREEEAGAAALLRRRIEQERKNREGMQGAQDGPGAPEGASADKPGGAPSAGLWARVRRVFGGGEG